MGQAIPQVGESEVLPHVLVIDHEPGKVYLEIHDDPWGKAHEKTQREPQHARAPKHPWVAPEPKHEHGQEGEPVDVGEAEPDPRGEAQEHGIRRRGLFLGEHSEEKKRGQRREHDRFRMITHGGHGIVSQQWRRETEQDAEIACYSLARISPDGPAPKGQRECEHHERRELQGEQGRPPQQEEAGGEGPDHQRP